MFLYKLIILDYRIRSALYMHDKFYKEMIIEICFDFITKGEIGDNDAYCYRRTTTYFQLLNCFDAKLRPKINKNLEFCVTFLVENVSIKIACRENYFVSFGIFVKKFFWKSFQLYLGLHQVLCILN